jgi:hypothetical protein
MRRSATVMSRVVVPATFVASMILTAAGAQAGSDPITTWVDDDGTVGAADCSGSQDAFTTIQLAVELAGPGDTINVCPGRYEEEVEIAGRAKRRLTLRSVVEHEAVIASPQVSHLHALVRVFSNRVTVDGFRLDLSPVGDDCGSGTGVYAQVETRLVVRNLVIEARPEAGTVCMYRGIEGVAKTLLTIESSVMTGFLKPILASGTLRITGNQLEPKSWRLPDDTYAPCAEPAITAIGLNREQPAVVKNNTIIQREPGGDLTPRISCAGIESHGVTAISDNVIDGFRVGIRTFGRPLVESNTIRNSVSTGLEIERRGEFRSNVIAGGTLGIVAHGQRAYVHDNTISAISDRACLDRTSPEGTGWPYTFGTGNRWVNNRGGPSEPVGLCTVAAS